MSTILRAPVAAGTLRSDVQRSVRMVEILKLTVQKHPPERLVEEAAMDDDDRSIIERHAVCIGSHPASSRLCSAASMSAGTYRVGTLDEERGR